MAEITFEGVWKRYPDGFEGVIQQVDTPKRLYTSPDNLFVAGFIGSPAMNFVPARLEEGKLRLPFGDAPIPAGVRTDKREVIAGIRPEHFEDAAIDGTGLRFRTRLDVVESMGSELYVYFEGGEVRQDQLDELAADTGVEGVPGAGSSVARLDAASKAVTGLRSSWRSTPARSSCSIRPAETRSAPDR